MIRRLAPNDSMLDGEDPDDDPKTENSEIVQTATRRAFSDELGPDPVLQGAAGNLPRIFDEFAKRLPRKKK